jgi:DNA mismatch endonuclease (patch repair protein)
VTGLTDIFPPEKRSEIMRRIRSYGTKPELTIKSLLDRLGVEYVYQAKVLGWSVDFLLPGRSLIVEYRSCFWHPHEGCKRSRVPKSRQEYWIPKLARNKERDKKKDTELETAGYRVFVIRDCNFKEKLKELHEMLGKNKKPTLP